MADFAAQRRVAMACLLAGGLTAIVGAPSFVSGAARPCTASFLGQAEQPHLCGTSSSSKSWTGASAAQFAAGSLAALACFQLATRVSGRRALRRAAGSDDAFSRRVVALEGGLAAAAAAAAVSESPARAELAPEDLPAKIKADPYDLIGMMKPDDAKEDKKEFYMKKQYREDTYQVLKHMKISGSLDKGTPNMEKWNKRVKEEMNDWVALYRRQDAVVGRQSYYALYSAVNTLASHFTSYGTKFPFPNKRRPRFYELINQTERFLEKNK